MPMHGNEWVRMCLCMPMHGNEWVRVCLCMPMHGNEWVRVCMCMQMHDNEFLILSNEEIVPDDSRYWEHDTVQELGSNSTKQITIVK